MSQKPPDAVAVQQLESAVHRLEALPLLASVAAKCLSLLTENEFSPLQLAEIIESDPVLAATVLSLMRKLHPTLVKEQYSITHVLEKIPLSVLSDTLYSLPVGCDCQEEPKSANPALFQKQLTLHSLAVACCAKEIAHAAPVQVDANLAYLAGLLHDIGKLVLQQTIPKSFAHILEQAKSQGVCLCVPERENTGLDHTIFGKRLAQLWNLPDAVIIAIWLHHAHNSLIAESIPNPEITQVVKLADLIARQCGIGHSGSYDAVDLSNELVKSLGLTQVQLQQIRYGLSDLVNQKSTCLGLNLPNTYTLYCRTVRSAAARLARQNTKLSLQNQQLQTASSRLEFMTTFLSGLSRPQDVVKTAENFVLHWQKFYQTGPVCLYWTLQDHCDIIQAVYTEKGSCKTVSLVKPPEFAAIPDEFEKGVAVLDAGDRIDWLLDQLDTDFDLTRTKLLPLITNNRIIGVIIFEFRHPSGTENLLRQLQEDTVIAALVLALGLSSRNQQSLAEQFALLSANTTCRQPRTKAAAEEFAALAEIAAGAAHELNNPLAVIVGRAQMLNETENDPRKKQLLGQIKENAGEISQVVDDLMSFARPPVPRPVAAALNQMLDEAAQLAAQKARLNQLDIQIVLNCDSGQVFVDSAQVVSGLANILANALQSYPDAVGPIKVIAEQTGGFVELRIIDSGCGMDSQTLEKATHPFFSSCIAGRKRGMGLAHARRLIELNSGTLNITSQPGTGTTVIVSLPCR